MLQFLLPLALLSAQEPDIIIKEPPAPDSYGGSSHIVCGRMSVEIAFDNSREKGLRRLEGVMKFSRAERSLTPYLSAIKTDSRDIYDVAQLCSGENEVRSVIKAGSKDGDLQEWELIVGEGFEVAVRGPLAGE